MVALHTSSLECIDRTLIDASQRSHAPIDRMVGVVVYLPFGIANLWLRAPYVRVRSALSAAEDAWSVSVRDASHGSCELCGMVGEKEVAAVSSESLQRVDSLVRCQSAGEIGPSVSKTDAVAHNPAHRVLLDVEVVHL